MTAIYTWFKRIHFGKWTDRKAWQARVEKVCQRWLVHMPVIPVKDKGCTCFSRKNDNVQSWQYAGLLLGLDDSFSKQFLETGPNPFLVPSVDKALLVYTLYKKHQLSKEALLDFARQLNIDGTHTIPYRDNLPDIRFVDALGMLVPFMAACGMEDAALAQLREFDPVLWKNVFPPHAFDIKRGLPLGVYDWSRGLGWYILGITEASHLEDCRDRIVRLAEEMKPLRTPDGGLGARFFSTSRVESSGTALLGLLFVKAFELTERRDFLDAARLAERALMQNTRRDGAVDFGQGDTLGIGIYSQRFDILPFAQGIALFLSKKLDRWSE